MAGDDDKPFSFEFELRGKRLARIFERFILRIDPSRIMGRPVRFILDRRSRGPFAGCFLNQTDASLVVQVPYADIASGFSAVFIVFRCNVRVAVFRASVRCNGGY